MANKFILDACCGCKFMWFDKENPNVIFNDIRKEEKGFIERRKNLEVNPNTQYDFRNLPFKNKQFKLITFDPPHLKGKMDKSTLKGCYGVIEGDFESYLGLGFRELWRCLDDYGVLFCKFNDVHISFKDIELLFPTKPLFQTSTNRSKNCITRWFCFMKNPNDVNATEEETEEEK